MNTIGCAHELEIHISGVNIQALNQTVRMIISLEGNIGAGKSTMLDRFVQLYDNDIIVIKEDLDAYTNMNGSVNILQEFYSNCKYSFAFQTVCLMSKVDKIQSILSHNPHAWIITERSIVSDRYMFADLLHKSGMMDNVEYQTYLYHYNRYQMYEPDIMVHLDVGVSTCYERIKMRNREGEENISMEYLTDLDMQMRSMLDTRNHGIVRDVLELIEFVDELST